MDILTGRGFGFWIKLLCSVQCSALKYKTVKLFAALGGGSVLGIEHHQDQSILRIALLSCLQCWSKFPFLSEDFDNDHSDDYIVEQ